MTATDLCGALVPRVVAAAFLALVLLAGRSCALEVAPEASRLAEAFLQADPGPSRDAR